MLKTRMDKTMSKDKKTEDKLNDIEKSLEDDLAKAMEHDDVSLDAGAQGLHHDEHLDVTPSADAADDMSFDDDAFSVGDDAAQDEHGGDELGGDAPQSKIDELKQKAQGLLKGANVYYAVIGVVIIAAIFLIYQMLFPQHHRAEAVKAQSHAIGFGVQAPVREHKNVLLRTSAEQHAPQSHVQARAQGAYQAHSFNAPGANGAATQTAQNPWANVNANASADNAKLVKQVKALSSSESRQSDNMKEAMGALAEQMQQINAKLAKYSAALIKSNKALAQTKVQLKLLLAQRVQGAKQYTLRAVVKGRAWLKSDETGKTISLTMGNRLKGYGTVTRIDSNNDKVYMSSGYVFS
jgi:hypothetical protein